MAIKAFVFDAYRTLYDVQSVGAATEAAFPGHGDYITQVWRLKAARVHLAALADAPLRRLSRGYPGLPRYTLGTIGLTADAAVLDRIVGAYDRLAPYPEAADALASLSGFQLAILSNGSPDMLDALVRNSGFDRYLKAVISVDAKRAYKPDPRAYELVQERLGVEPREVVFVSSNGFDVAGASSFGFKVVRIERVTPDALRQELGRGEPVGAATMFRALRTQSEALGRKPDAEVSSLRALPGLVASLAG